MNEGITFGNKEPIQMNEIDEFTQELSQWLQKLTLNSTIDTVQELESESSSELDSTNTILPDTINKVYSTSKPYYSRPTPIDIQFEDKIPVHDHFDGRSLVEWNLDGFTEY